MSDDFDNEPMPDGGVTGQPAHAGGWQRRVIGWGALAALASALLAAVANLSEIAGWLKPDETRVLVEETRGVIEGTDSKVEELLTLLRNQAAAAGVDLNIESETAIRNAIAAIVASGNARKQTALGYLDNGDVTAAAEAMAGVAASQAAASGETAAAAAASWREAGALYYTYDVARAVAAYEQANRLQPGDPATQEMLAYSLNRAGRLDDAGRVFRELIDGDPPPAIRASAELGLGSIAKQRGRYAEARTHLSAALATAESRRLVAERIYALAALAQLEMAEGATQRAVGLLEQALALAEEYADDDLLAKVLDSSGTLAARQARYDDAEALLQRALDIHVALKDNAGRARALGNLGAVALLRGDIDAAESMLLETVELGEQLGWQSSVAYDLVNLGGIAAARQDFAQADAYLGRAQDIAETVGLAELAPVIVFNRGELARDAGDMDAACRYWREALPALEAMGSEHTGTARQHMLAATCTEATAATN